jgi:hypothetical protein
MILSYLKKTAFIILILFSFFQKSKQSIEFTLYEQIIESSCEENKGTFDILIKGVLEGITKDQNYNNQLLMFPIVIGTSNGKNLEAICYPTKKTNEFYFSCKIDIVQNPLNTIDIFLPVKTPEVKNFILKKWEEVIGANPGVSNKIQIIECLPEETNTFFPSNITINQCYYKLISTHLIIINGTWEDKIDDTFNYDDINITLDNEDKDIMLCEHIQKPISFLCFFKGRGRIKFNEQLCNFRNRDVYKIKGFDSGQTIDKCSDGVLSDDENIEKFLSGSFYFLNINIILIFILLF